MTSLLYGIVTLIPLKSLAFIKKSRSQEPPGAVRNCNLQILHVSA